MERTRCCQDPSDPELPGWEWEEPGLRCRADLASGSGSSADWAQGSALSLALLILQMDPTCQGLRTEQAAWPSHCTLDSSVGQCMSAPL